ncbi:hypothetical protein A6J82_11320 [Streptococcus agalactiae]|nr:hypothetical protein A6J82_11320 [Streptococcus agalactiae]
MRIYWNNVTNVLENINRKRLSYLLSLRLKTKSSEVILLGIFLALKEYNKRKKVFDEVFLCFTKKILNTIDVK